MMIPMLRAVAWLAARDTHACVWENKDTWLEMACLSSFVLFWPGFGLSGLVMAFLACVWPFWHSITWLFAKKMSFVFIHRTVNMVYKRVCRNCPISSCGAKYLVRLANHLADVHQLDHIQRRQYLQEAKLQPKVKVVVYESEADNSGKKSLSQSSTDKETVYCELSRSQRNEASFKAKAKRPTTKNKTKRKKQRKSNSWLRSHTKIV